MPTFFLSFAFVVLTSSIAIASATRVDSGWMICRSKQNPCEYSCPKKFDRETIGCLPIRGTNCTPTGFLAALRPMGSPPKGYIASFDIGGTFPELLCRDSKPWKPRVYKNPIREEYRELFHE